ncbi:uncharacterized protein [Panulirus ornatus]|uniref:uncharacterized protein n=1 Tax=Panulirus ornatus TaxID=150431 RepID=UPI003A8C0BBB
MHYESGHALRERALHYGSGPCTTSVGRALRERAVRTLQEWTEVDISLGPVAISLSSSKAVDFTHPFITEDVVILKSKGLPEIDPWGFLFPLAPLVWAGLLTALLVAWLAVVMLGGHHGKTSGRVTWASKMLFQHIRIFFRQDVSLGFLYSRERLVVGGWLLVAMMVTWSYTGNLVSLLAVRHIPQPIQTIRHLVDDTSLTVMLQPDTILTDVLFNIESGDLKALGDLMHKGRMKYVYTPAHARVVNTLVHRGDHVLLTVGLAVDRYIGDFFSKTGKCDFYKARETLVSITFCSIGQKGNPIVPAISQRIRAMVESGLYNHWVENNIPYFRNCRSSPSKITVREPLAINNLWTYKLSSDMEKLVGIWAMILTICSSDVLWYEGSSDYQMNLINIDESIIREEKETHNDCLYDQGRRKI